MYLIASPFAVGGAQAYVSDRPSWEVVQFDLRMMTSPPGVLLGNSFHVADEV